MKELRTRIIGRSVVAAILAPAIVPLGYFLAMRFCSGFTAQSTGHAEKLLDLTLKAILIPSYVLSYVLGSIIFCLLSRLRRLAFIPWLGSWAVSGAGIGLFVVARAVPLSRWTISEAVAALLVFEVPFAIAGCLTSALFWWIAGVGRVVQNWHSSDSRALLG